LRFISSALRRPSISGSASWLGFGARRLSAVLLAFLSLALLSLSLPFSAMAQEPSAPSEPMAQAATSVAEPESSFSADSAGSSSGKPRVVDAVPAEQVGPAADHLELHNTLAVKVEALTALIGANAERCYDLRLYFDGQAVQGLKPERCLLAEQQVWFQLWRIDRAGEKVWLDLLAEREGLVARVDVTVGLKNGEALPTEVRGNRDRVLRLVPPEILSTAVGLLIVAFLAFLWLNRRTGILRESLEPGADRAARRRVPYSLARVQVAWWFFLILGSFLFISILVGDMANIPSSVLGLMTIAAGTYMGSEMIDEGMEEREEGPEEEGEAPPPPPVKPRSRGLLMDILSGPSGHVAFYCFQIVVWTLVVGGFFLLNVVRNLSMPDIPIGLLGLMGISGGTYLGMKFPAEERRSKKESSGGESFR
jgi:Ca2+/Na+ antiporter